MRRLLPLVSLAVALGSAPPAVAQTTSAAGTVSGSGTSYSLSVLNTGQSQIQCLRFEPAAGVQVTAATGPGTVNVDPSGFSASNVAIGPDQSATFAFTTSGPYPPNGGGALFVSSTCQPGSDVRGEVTGPAPANPQPVRGESHVVEVLTGVVRVRRRGARRFVRLTGARLIPDGSEIDTRRGTLRLTVDHGDGTTKSADISEGRAVVDQTKASQPVTTLRLSEPLACRPRANDSAVAAAKRRKRRRLFARTDGGRFRTRGRYGAAVASGTAWRTTDICDATIVDIVEGTVRVRSLRSGRTVTAEAPRRVVVLRRRR